MPILEDTYHPVFWSRSAHLATIIPNKLRKIEGVTYTRDRVELADGDFIDLDHSKVGSDTLVLILHGLEGNSDRAYARAIVRSANDNDWDACVMNQRSCSGELNRLLSSYHSGKSDDLNTIVQHIEKTTSYQTIFLYGVSLGGNITLKYLGEHADQVSPLIKGAVTVSVPTDLASSAQELARSGNWVYMRRFLKSLKAKSLDKIANFPESGITEGQVMACKNFIDYDNLYTAPIHGFHDAEDYWRRCSSRQFIPHISVPTLLITSLDDPFLGETCYPVEEARTNDQFSLLLTKHGGHVGFVDSSLKNPNFLEREALAFLNAR